MLCGSSARCIRSSPSMNRCIANPPKPQASGFLKHTPPGRNRPARLSPGRFHTAWTLKIVYRGGCGSALDAERASPSVAMNGSRSGDLEHRGRSDEMAHFVGLDVSVKETSVCVVDDAGKVILEQKVPTEPSDIIALLTSLGVTYGRIGI